MTIKNMGTGIKHIEFWTSNLGQALDFYKPLFSLIGWQQIDSNGFSDGKMKIYFIQQSVEFTKNIGPRHICFLADSREVVDKVGTWLKSIQAGIIKGPIDYPYNNRRSYTVDFKDPDGYILEVATRSV